MGRVKSRATNIDRSVKDENGIAELRYDFPALLVVFPTNRFNAAFLPSLLHRWLGESILLGAEVTAFSDAVSEGITLNAST